MSLWNPYAYTLLGDPMAPAAPPALRVIGGQATAAQLGAAQAAFYGFCMRSRLSSVPNQTERGALTDGTPYRIVCIGRTTIMEIYPAAADKKHDFIAWTVFVDAGHLPVWDRPVMDLPTFPPLPPEPTPPSPPEYVYAYFPTTTTAETISYEKRPMGGYSYVLKATVIRVTGPDQTAEQSFTGTHTRTYIPPDTENETGYYENVFINSPELRPYVGSDGKVVLGYYEVWLRNGVIYEQTDLDDAFTVTDTGALRSALASQKILAEAANATNDAIRAGYNLALIAHGIAFDEWDALRIERESNVGQPHMPLIETRRQARSAQIASVWGYLLGGIGDRHLTARLLSFPYSVGYKSTPPAFSGGSAMVYEPLPETAGDVGRTTTLADAGPFTAMTGSPDYSRALRVDVMPPECLFGWKASGSFVQAHRFPENHRNDLLAMKPPGLGDISFSYSPDYFSSAALVPDSSGGLRVDSDAFVPIGAKFTTVIFEYLVLDPFTGDQVWTPCPELVWHDSIWLRSLGDKNDTPRYPPGEGSVPTTTEVRVGAAITQTRTGWSTWSTAQRVAGRGQGRPYVANMVRDTALRNTPTAVVIAERLPSAANPTPVQPLSFYGNASFLWSGNPTELAAAKSAAWVSDAAAAPQSQFILLSLKSTEAINP